AGGNPDLSVQKLIGQNGFLRFRILDSRLRGNDESIRTETCTASFPRKWESSFLSFSHSR
ncbi:TPA: hypothetical protein ACJJCQ_002143, partial [Neisseria meningitidis]